ncbi:MAG TPA: MlaD family protein [bacterium]|nr:MlaD family protein [bacterium]HPG44675.1 MlaD family protein [bacterium]HPM99418.1 MlaD family protein [bacterium]
MNRREQQERKHEIKVGFTILLGLSILVFTILYVGQNKGVLRPRYRLHCMMSRVNGLQSGAPVQLAGVRVGSVISVEFSPSYEDRKIEVILEIDKVVQPRIRQDSEAYIGTMGLLGDKYVGISMGSMALPVLNEGEMLTSSDPVDIEKLIDEGVDVFAALRKTSESLTDITHKIDEGRGTLGMLINDPRMYYDIDRILLLLESLTIKVEKGKGSMAKLFSDPRLYDELAQTLFSTRQMVDSLRQGQGSMGQLLTDRSLYDNLTVSTENIKSLTERLEDGQGSMGKVLVDEQLYKQLQSVVTQLDSLVTDIKKNPKRYLKVEIF